MKTTAITSTCGKFAVLATALGLALVSIGASRPMPEYLKSAVVYQIVLHNFTHFGTFKAAMAMLPHVRSTGADVVYLTPFFEMDRDMDRKFWSPRQIKSGYDSPLNPYRIADYNKIDPIYGTDKDFDAFCAKAHSLGMKVFLDLVYLHCGPTCPSRGTRRTVRRRHVPPRPIRVLRREG